MFTDGLDVAGLDVGVAFSWDGLDLMVENMKLAEDRKVAIGEDKEVSDIVPREVRDDVVCTMGEDSADSANAVFAVLVSEILAVASTDVVSVLVDIVAAPRDASDLDGVVERAVLPLVTVSSVVSISAIGNSGVEDSIIAVGVIIGKDIIGVPVVVGSSRVLETKECVVEDEGSTDKRLGETVEEEDSTVDDGKVVVSVDMSLVMGIIDDVVTGSSGPEKAMVVVEDASVEVSVQLSVDVGVDVGVDVDIADDGAG